jgi:hypothetical protein
MKKLLRIVLLLTLMQVGCAVLMDVQVASAKLGDVPADVLPRLKTYLPNFKVTSKAVEIYTTAEGAIDKFVQYGFEGDLGGKEVMVMYAPEIGSITIMDLSPPGLSAPAEARPSRPQ